MRLNSLKVLLPDVYKEENSNSFKKLFHCTGKKLDYFGLNFQDTEFNSIKYKFKRIIPIMMLVFCISLVLKEILHRPWANEHYFNIGLVGSTISMIVPRILLMFLYRNELNELIGHVVKTTQPDYFKLMPDLESQLYAKYFNISRTMTRVLYFLYHLGAMMAAYLPIVNNEWFLLFYTVTPWLEYKSHPGYEISLVIETYIIFYVVGIMEAFDNYFYYFTFYVLMKCDVYIAMISKIGDYSSEYNNDEKQSLLIRQLCLIQVDLHRFVTKFTKIFSVYVLGQGVFSLFEITLSLLTIKSVCMILITLSLLSFFVLFSIVSAQLFFLSAFGEMVLWKASGISNGIYCSQWYQIKSIKDKKILLHLLHNSQRKMTFTAMGVYEFSLATFATIMQKAYGFYTFLQNVK